MGKSVQWNHFVFELESSMESVPDWFKCNKQNKLILAADI